MRYALTEEAVFVDRPNRFVAHVLLHDKVQTVHVKNTGRCRELLLPGSRVILADSQNPARKTRYDLVAVWKNGLGWVNIDSQAPNQLLKEWLEEQPGCFPGLSIIKPEYSYGQSRIDFCLECGGKKTLLEVKGCTLEIDGMGYFPDAPTERGTKHLRQLISALNEGFECFVAFVIAMPQVRDVAPKADTDPDFTLAFYEAKAAGVHFLCLPCAVGPDEIRITGWNEI